MSIKSALVQREFMINELNTLLAYSDKRGLTDISRRIKASRDRIERLIPVEEITYPTKVGLSFEEMINGGHLQVTDGDHVLSQEDFAARVELADKARLTVAENAIRSFRGDLINHLEAELGKDSNNT